MKQFELLLCNRIIAVVIMSTLTSLMGFVLYFYCLHTSAALGAQCSAVNFYCCKTHLSQTNYEIIYFTIIMFTLFRVIEHSDLMFWCHTMRAAAQSELCSGDQLGRKIHDNNNYKVLERSHFLLSPWPLAVSFCREAGKTNILPYNRRCWH